MTKDQLDAIRARVEVATPGPWRASRWPSNNPRVSDAWGLSGMVTFADADFCGHAREDVPALLAEVEQLREACTGLVKQNERQYDEVLRLTAYRDAAFARGVSAMREAAAKIDPYELHLSGAPYAKTIDTHGSLIRIMQEGIRALPDPEDTE